MEGRSPTPFGSDGAFHCGQQSMSAQFLAFKRNLREERNHRNSCQQDNHFAHCIICAWQLPVLFFLQTFRAQGPTSCSAQDSVTGGDSVSRTLRYGTKAPQLFGRSTCQRCHGRFWKIWKMDENRDGIHRI